LCSGFENDLRRHWGHSCTNPFDGRFFICGELHIQLTY
jgi:hypothetical protein